MNHETAVGLLWFVSMLVVFAVFQWDVKRYSKGKKLMAPAGFYMLSGGFVIIPLVNTLIAAWLLFLLWNKSYKEKL